MTKDEIFSIIKEHVKTILPNLSGAEITIDKSLRELGANSIDRMEILTMTLESLNLQLPLTEFGQAKNIQGLVDLLAGRN